MATYSSYRLPIPEAAHQASLVGIDIDLTGVITYCDHLIEQSNVSKLNFIVWEAMSSAAVIRYARCFSTGTREQLPHDLLDGADSELREAHEYFIALRSKHFAHSVNPFEENDVTVQIGDHFESSEEITEINSVHGRTVGLSFSDPEQLKQLAEWVHLKVRKMMEEERVKLLGFARMRPLAELKAYGIPSPGSDATRSNVKKKRARP